jgi:hypothetical protein
MRDLEQFPDRRIDTVIFDWPNEALLYGHRVLEEMRSSAIARELFTVRAPSEAFLAYLGTHFPNYSSVQRLLQAVETDEPPENFPALYRAVSYQVQLEVGDLQYIIAGRHHWENANPEDR